MQGNVQVIDLQAGVFQTTEVVELVPTVTEDVITLYTRTGPTFLLFTPPYATLRFFIF